MSYNFKGQKIIINGVEQVIIPGPLPQNPTNGMYAIDSSDGLFKVYNETKSKWIPLEDFAETVKGSLDVYTFMEGGSASNEWLEYCDNSINSDETPAILPFDAKLIACTYTNKKDDTDTDIQVYKAAEGSGSSSSRVTTFEVRNKRVARFSDFNAIQFQAGDKLSVFLRDKGGNPDDVVVKLYFLITNFNKENAGENYSSDFSLSIGGITITIG